MPNWCNNELRISGPAEAIAKFKQQAIGFNPWSMPPKDEEPSPLNFHSLVPIPADVLKADYALVGHDWEVKHWGTRWGACDVQLVEEAENFLCYHFDTAWAPAVEFIRHARQQWPALTFVLDYDEPGMGYKGLCKGQGEHFEDHRITY
jgi:hypothetical protein